MAKRKRTPAEKVERKKKVFRIFKNVVLGAVKIWLNTKEGIRPFVVHMDDVNEFIEYQINQIKK
jgi:hypothetical protein